MSSVKINPKVSKYLDIFVSGAAALVIWGALQKILHTPSANLWLKIGLTCEALIFAIYALLYIISPLADDSGSLGQPNVSHGHAHAAPQGNNAQNLNTLLDGAGITNENLSKLSHNFHLLTATTEKIADVSHAVANTADYARKAKDAGHAFDTMKDTLNQVSTTINTVASMDKGFKSFAEQVLSVNKNLSALNTVYEMELQENNNHIKSLSKFYGQLDKVAQSFASTAEDALKAKNQMTALTENLTKLNSIYGNIISAMQTTNKH
ncbi:MAG: gliding motility protein GldL [Phycisphaerales bacterium]|nr:gliding motility protein GldL [Phycisphaerales bacterium]